MASPSYLPWRPPGRCSLVFRVWTLQMVASERPARLLTEQRPTGPPREPVRVPGKEPRASGVISRRVQMLSRPKMFLRAAKLRQSEPKSVLTPHWRCARPRAMPSHQPRLSARMFPKAARPPLRLRQLEMVRPARPELAEPTRLTAQARALRSAEQLRSKVQAPVMRRSTAQALVLSSRKGLSLKPLTTALRRAARGSSRAAAHPGYSPARSRLSRVWRPAAAPMLPP